MESAVGTYLFDFQGQDCSRSIGLKKPTVDVFEAQSGEGERM